MNVMDVDFVILSGYTVPDDYIWDKGIPFDSAATTKYIEVPRTEQSYISGYAPALRLLVYNDSIILNDFGNINFEWNFGDYYNDSNNNYSLPCISLIEHTYIMPGIYSVSLKLTQTKQTEDFDITGNSKLCRGKFGVRWFWDELLCGKTTALTWNDTACGSSKQKWWDDEVECFEKYCKTWAWADLATEGSNPVYWNQTSTDAEYVKKWTLEPNDTVCKVTDAEFLTTKDFKSKGIIKKYLVEVKEKPPVAAMQTATRPITGYSPFIVQLSPRACKTGSFPIDRIDWDFGDGSPVKTISRYTAVSGGDLVYNNAFPLDIPDVRNYDILHAYKRTRNTYSIFYPSLTCYSANTNTHDSCSITIGPVALSSISSQAHFLKSRNTLKGNLYAMDIDDNVAFFTTNEIPIDSSSIITIPKNPIRDSFGAPELGFYGNRGLVWPTEYIADCSSNVIALPQNYITTEDSTPSTLTDMLSDEGLAILSETNLAFIP
jgi:PKD repeat protein